VKIAHVVRSDSFAGVERYICLVAPRLAARGCEVTVIGGDQSRMRRAADSVHWRPAPTTAAAAAQLARLGRVDVVHAHMTAAELASVLTKPWHHARLVATLHFASPRGSTKTGRPLRALGRLMDDQIAISRFVAAAVSANRVLPNGVEVADAGPAERERSVLVMQRLEVEKQTDVVLRAWSASRLRHRGWRLVIAGRGSHLTDLQRLARELKLTESVEWPGFVDDPARLLSRSAVFLAPAPAEPFGLTVVEAMARATPVVAADGGAHRETVGVDGWLFPVGDADACARILDDVGSRDLASYGAWLRTRQRELFDIENHTDALLQIYRGLIS
jgi:glycosyltransferase involved in cell wall biosynthesis